MRPDEIQAIASVAQAVLALCTFVGTIVVSLFVYYGARRIAKSQYLRTVYDAWMTLDIFLLSHPEHLRLYNMIARPHSAHATDEETTKRHITFLILNPLASYYYGVKNGYIADNLLRLEASLAVVLQDEAVYAQTQEGLFSEEFATFCKSVKAKNASHPALQSS